MQFESLKEKCEYLRSLTDYKLMPNGYIIVMVDGHSFSKKIKKKFDRPFDDKFINAMNETAQHVCKNVQGVQCAYVQSDEISFMIKDTSMQGAFFRLRMSKMLSLISAFATSKFNAVMTSYAVSEMTDAGEIKKYLADQPLYEFDCKVWNVPDENDAFAWFLYRQIDCIRNSKQQTAQAYLSHNILVGKNSDEQIDMLKREKGIDWHTDLDYGKKQGRLIVKRHVNVNGADRSKWVAIHSPLWTDKTSNDFIAFIDPTFPFALSVRIMKRTV